jgi:hypothetical protein
MLFTNVNDYLRPVFLPRNTIKAYAFDNTLRALICTEPSIFDYDG